MFKKIPNKMGNRSTDKDLDLLFSNSVINEEIKRDKDPFSFLAEEKMLNIPITKEKATPFFEFWGSVGYLIGNQDAKFMKKALDSDNITSFLQKNSSKMDRLQSFVNNIDEIDNEKTRLFKDKVNSNAFFLNEEAVRLAFLIALGSFATKRNSLKGLVGPDVVAKSKNAPVYIIWKNVTGEEGYYRTMEKLEGVDERKVKDNTADIILSNNRNILDILRSMTKLDPKQRPEIKSDSSTGVLSMKIPKTGKELKWAQISLKKAKGDARIGAAGKTLDRLTGGKLSGADLLKQYKEHNHAMLEESVRQLVNEGIVDNVFNFVKKAASAAVKTVSEAVKGIFDFVKEMFNYVMDSFDTDSVDESVNRLSREVGIEQDLFQQLVDKSTLDTPEPDGNVIEESTDERVETVQKGVRCRARLKKDGNFSEFEEALFSLSKPQREALVKKANALADELIKFAKKSDKFIVNEINYSINEKAASLPANNKAALDCNDYRQIVANIIGFDMILKFLKIDEVEATAEELVEKFIDISKDVIMGNTDLPLIKVYGKNDKQRKAGDLDSDEAEVFTLDKVNAIRKKMEKNLQSDDFLLGAVNIRQRDDNNGFFNFNVFGIFTITDEGHPLYIDYSIRNSSSSSYSLQIVGATVVSKEKVLATIKSSSEIQ